MKKEEKIAKLNALASPKSTMQKYQNQVKWNKEHEEALEDYYKIAAKIAIRLKEEGMTQKQLADKLGIKAQALSRIMKGRQNLSLLTIRKIGKALDLKLIEILKDEPNNFQNIWHNAASSTINKSKEISGYQFEIVGKSRSKEYLKIAN